MENTKTKKIKISDLILIALFAAITAVMSQISIPMPSGVPVTLQTFAVALCGYYLGVKKGPVAILVYILLGAVGVPVFSGFKGGFACIGGLTGGFIYGFLAMVALCGINFALKHKAAVPPLRIALGFLGVLACHFCGAAQYALLTDSPFIQAFLLVSAPYLIKDFASVAVAYFAALAITKATAKIQLTTH